MLIAKYKGHFRDGIALRKEGEGGHLYESCMYCIQTCNEEHWRSLRHVDVGAQRPPRLYSVEDFDFFDKSFCQQQYKISQVRHGKGEEKCFNEDTRCNKMTRADKSQQENQLKSLRH